MQENPYQPTAEPAQLQPTQVALDAASSLRSITDTQRRILINVLLHLGFVALSAILRLNGLADWMPIAYGGLLITWCTGTYFLAVLAFRVESRGAAILLTLLAAIPIAGFLVVIRTHHRANLLLRRHGVDVGFFGARPAEISPAA